MTLFPWTLLYHPVPRFVLPGRTHLVEDPHAKLENRLMVFASSLGGASG